MTEINAGARADTRPMMDVTYEGDDRILLERIVPMADVIEVTPDAIATSNGKSRKLRSEVLDEYSSVKAEVDFIVHGVGLSIGSFDARNESYLQLLDGLFERFPILWHSEHLGYTTVSGENIGTMLPVPRTEEALDLVCERVRLIQESYRVPFLLEHVIQLLPAEIEPFTSAGFLNAITHHTGCGLIIDAYNLECDAWNQGLNLTAFLAELDASAVRELHVAGGVQLNRFQLDIHSRLLAPTTLMLAHDIIRQAPNLRVITYEFLKEAVPVLGHDAICGELRRIEQAIGNDRP